MTSSLSRVRVPGCGRGRGRGRLRVRRRRSAGATEFWPQWRGPNANGVSRVATPPLDWSETKNIRWKVQIPGPRIRIADRLGRPDLPPRPPFPWVSTGDAQHAPRGALPSPWRPPVRRAWPSIGQTGRTVWERVAREQEPHEGVACRQRIVGVELGRSPTDSTVYAYFESFGLYAYDMDGKLRLGEGPRRQADAERVRRRVDARAPRRHPRRRVGPPERRRVVRRRARQARRIGALARAPATKSTRGPRRSCST